MAKLYTLALTFLLAGVMPVGASAATIYLSPSSGTYSVGSTLSVGVYVTSADQAMNAVSGTVIFPSDKLQVISLSKAGSVMSLWVQEPSFSNSAGTVTAEGVVLNPGFTGSAGKVITIQFRVKDTGSATVSLSSASVLANDGSGTNILKNLGNAQFDLSAGEASPAPSVSTAPATPSAEEVVITSPTHPDQTKWYKTADAELNWKNPADATAVRIGYDKYPSGRPTVVYTPLISQKTLNLKEGAWYFHLQEKNADGWGPISNFRLRIDTTPPHSFHIQFPRGATTDASQPLALFTTTDGLSGVDYYEVTVKGSSSVRISNDDISDSPYPLPVQNPGPGSVKVTAYDKAGNSVSDQADFEVIGLEPPVLGKIADITIGEVFPVSGTTYPNASVSIFVKSENGQISSQSVASDAAGAFYLTWKERLPSGVYTVWAQTTGDKGAKSTISSEVNFQIKESTPLVIGRLTINYLSLAIIVIAIIGLLLFGCWYLWHYFHAFRRRLLGKIAQTEVSIHGEFEDLKKAIAEEVSALESMKSKRELTAEEARFINRFKKMLDKSERIIEKEITNIAK